MLRLSCVMQYKYENSGNYGILKFTVPAIWTKPQNKRNCYFCINNAKKWRIFNKKPVTYNIVSSVIESQI